MRPPLFSLLYYPTSIVSSPLCSAAWAAEQSTAWLTTREKRHSGPLYWRVHCKSPQVQETKLTTSAVEQILINNSEPHFFIGSAYNLASVPQIFWIKIYGGERTIGTFYFQVICLQIREPPNRQIPVGKILVFPGKLLALPLYFFKSLA